MTASRILLGEFVGSFLLIALGCGLGAAMSLAGGAPLWVYALIWWLAVTGGVYASRGLSGAHMNPVFTLVFVLLGDTRRRDVPAYLLGQFLGCFVGAAALYAVLAADIAAYEATHGIARGAAASVRTAAFFTVFFPSPGGVVALSPSAAFLAETVATFTLVAAALTTTDRRSPATLPAAFGPVAVGAVVALLIMTVAPLTGTGLNPAREAGPRLFVRLAGWGDAALAADGTGGFLVYWLAPLLGGSLAALVYRAMITRRVV